MNEKTLTSLGYPQIQKTLPPVPYPIWANVTQET